LERLAQVLQKTIPDTFKTDLFQPLVKKVETLSGKRYGDDPDADRSIRIVVEHGRAAAFLVADGIQPSNEWRGYVLRRLIRRAELHARRLGLKAGALAAIGSEVVKHMQQHYPELTRARDRIPETLREEEAKFERTLTTGLEQLNGAIEAAKGAGYTWIDGDTTFRLYDTFGFPLEMTREIAAGAGLTIDEPGFRPLLAAPGVIVMSTKVVDGVLRAGARAHAAVDADLRRDTMRNHTATHLLHATLRRLFGEDVHQAGSLVHAPNLRFDFTFNRALS